MTLLEIVVALAIAATVMVILGQILLSSTRSVDYVIVDANSDGEMKMALSHLLDELRPSSPAVISVTAPSAAHDAITFQTPDTYGGSVDWGAVTQAGVWRAGWSVQYLVVDGNLVRRVLDGAGTAAGGDVVLAHRLDGLDGARKGFQITLNGPVVTAAIRTRRTFSDAKDATKEFESTVYLQNT